MSESLDKQVNVQKESLKKTSGVLANSLKSMKKCAMKMKERKTVLYFKKVVICVKQNLGVKKVRDQSEAAL